MLSYYRKYKNLIVTVIIVVTISAVTLQLILNADIFLGVLSKILSLSASFVYGIVIAYILNPIVKFLEKRLKVRRASSILMTYGLLIGALTIGGIFGLPSLIESIKDMAGDMPSYIASLQAFTQDVLAQEDLQSFLTATGLGGNIQGYVDQMGIMLMTTLEASLMKMISLSSIVINFVLGLLIAIYILADKEGLLREAKRVLYLVFKKGPADKIIEFLKTYHSMIGTYIGIKAVDSSIIAVMAFVLLSLVGSEYTLVLSIIVGITNMIPYFGPFIGEIIGFLIHIFVSPVKAITVFLVLFALQNFDGWYLDPKLIGDKVGVRPIWIIYAVVIGGGFFGPIGMLLASPTAATIKIYYHKLLKKNSDLFVEEIAGVISTECDDTE